MTDDLRPSWSRAAPLLAPYTSDIGVGSPAADVSMFDQDGRPLRLFEDAFAGHTLVLVFCGPLDNAEVSKGLAGFARVENRLQDAGAKLIIVSSRTDARQARGLKDEIGLAAPVCGDGNGSAFAQYGLGKGTDMPGRLSLRTVIVTPNRQVRAIMDEPQSASQAASIVDSVSEEGAAARHWVPGHAPILIIPNALTPDDCAALIGHFTAGGDFAIAKSSQPAPEGMKLPVYDYNRQDRIDHIISDQAILQRIDQRLHERVVPMVKKAFAFDVTQREPLHIARYNGPRDGIEVGHRDNVAASSAHRKFALSINLNDDFEGGELVFSEYAPQGYRAAPGTALVFSSSLLHEVQETTKGIRYNLISHFY